MPVCHVIVAPLGIFVVEIAVIRLTVAVGQVLLTEIGVEQVVIVIITLSAGL